jgi:hypothetical protein
VDFDGVAVDDAGLADKSAVKAALVHATNDNKAAAQYRKAARHKSK